MAHPVPVLIALTLACLFQARAATLTVFAGDVPKLPSMKPELAEALEPMQFTLSWRSLDTRRAGEDFERVVVVEFRGDCSADGLSSANRDLELREAPTLASAAVSSGRVLPFIQIECDKLRMLLGSKLVGMPMGERTEAMGKAVGRLLAHELYHVLSQAKHHSDKGLSRSCFRVEDLLARRFEFDARSLALMRAPAASAPRSEPATFDAGSFTDDFTGR